ncbi:FAD-dependent oxidoreductase [Vibrio breoganii]|uniref:FAD-dependent oxidoreductase n=1 Tax=Vibrio breoganii TaxID=553239 RepID=A0AAP8MYM8_9VIBR|nr:NAD(P)/FAD-dependent oxidoreductase [Vibrio breoganii]OED84856.1 FAD-dependent oxidoreductase [Vibrio breoganii ZF-55]PMP14034.1 FAD-dependent oxidoreductase [Vibrio breoganii]
MVRECVQVIVVGAGPSGSIASALLKAQGIDVVVIEKTEFPRFSIGESLLPACMEVIEKAGMLTAVKQYGFQYKNGAAFRRGNTYSEIRFEDKFTAGPFSTYQVKRGEFDKLLADSASEQGVDIRYGHELKQLDFVSDKTLLLVERDGGDTYEIQTNYVLDASGFGRVLPRLLDLEEPSCLPPRTALFTHIEDNVNALSMDYDREKILVSVHPENNDVWFWLIPFSDGTSSLGVVATPEFFDEYSTDKCLALKALVSEEPGLARLLEGAEYPNPIGELAGYSANVKHLATSNYALLGNAGEFLDPVFSSGVTIAMKSAEYAAECVVRQLAGNKVDWEKEYSEPLMTGVNTFRTYVEGWYDGSFQDVVFHQQPNERILEMISAILAGYAWDVSNPFVKHSKRKLTTLSELIRDTSKQQV